MLHWIKQLKMRNQIILLVVVLIVLAYGLLLLFYKPASLFGIWVGEGYSCIDGSSSTQEVLVREELDLVIATKIEGDDCIGAREVSWEGMRDGHRIVGLYYTRPIEATGEPGAHLVEVVLHGRDTLILQGPEVPLLTFTRQQ